MTVASGSADLGPIKSSRPALVAALRDAGAQLADGASSLRCPFHPDRNASAGIHEHDGVWLYTCQSCGWNGGKGTGDIFAVVQAAKKCDFKTALGHLGANGHAGHNGNGAPVTAKVRPTATDVDAAQKLAIDSVAQLMASTDALEHLWRTRGIDRATAEKLGLGITGEPGRRYVTMPITDAGGKFIAIKAHRMDGQAQKSWWQPKGADSKQTYPKSIDGPGPIWLCPGELKAAAVAGVGLPVVGITAGEGVALPDHAITLLKDAGRLVALVPDDDEAGTKWGAKILRQLTDAGIDARIVDLGLDASAGLKDIGDWLVRERIENARTVEAMRESLLHAYKLADPWGPFTFAGIIASPETWRPVTYVKTGFPRWDALAGGGLRTRGVHLIPGRPGQGKSTLAVQVASNAAVAGVPVGIISLEMTREDLAKLVVAQNTAIPRRVLDKGQFADGYSQPFNDFRNESTKMPMTILDDDHWQGPLDREGLAKLVAEGVKRLGWKLVVVDYLGLIAPSASDQGNFDTELRNSSALKRMASKYDIALLVVAALRKFTPSRKVGEASKVTLDDVSGAGRLTYDATSVWYVESEQQPTSPPSGTLWVHGLKARFSGAASLGEVLELRWAPHTGQVSDIRSYE